MIEQEWKSYEENFLQKRNTETFIQTQTWMVKHIVDHLLQHDRLQIMTLPASLCIVKADESKPYSQENTLVVEAVVAKTVEIPVVKHSKTEEWFGFEDYMTTTVDFFEKLLEKNYVCLYVINILPKSSGVPIQTRFAMVPIGGHPKIEGIV